ncbi:MAG: hypothetical protein Q8N15_05455 [Bacillota bacterium]|nr:hypothetical protein [Bacillota bacterium]
MKRRIAILFVLMIATSLSACSLFPTLPTFTTAATTTISTNANTETQPSTTTAVTTMTTATNPLTTTTHGLTTSTTSPMVTTTQATTAATTSPQAQPFTPTGYALLQDEMDYVGLPSVGDVKLLVFVVDFTDAPLSLSGVSLTDIENAFNGDSTNTAYESLASYYEKSSYGKLHLSADILTYHAPHPVQWYTDDYIDYYTESDLIFDMMTYYDSQIDFSDYDQNGDGDIDGIYVLYTAPVDYDSTVSELWWAYQYYYEFSGEDYFDGKTPYFFCWSGTDFLLEAEVGIDAHTLIHETGHMLGLDDYYDYDDSDPYNNDGGVGSADMMDYAVGDHSAVSKILLGWITPLVVTTSMTVDLLPLVTSGQVVLLIDEWNDTIFDEYLLISYYAPTGLNEYDNYYIFTIPGVLIQHVDTRITTGTPENSAYSTLFDYNNTDTVHKFLAIIEADENDRIVREAWCEDGDLFQVGDIFRGNIEVAYDWYQLTRDMNFTIAITAVGTTASITFTFE